MSVDELLKEILQKMHMNVFSLWNRKQYSHPF